MKTIVCALLVVLAAEARAQDTSLSCVSTPSVRRVSVVSYRNETGHWTAELEFEHRKEPEGPSKIHDGLMHVNIDVSSEMCEGLELSTRVKFTFSSAPQRPIVPGYEHAPGVGFYKLHTELATWSRAREICAEEGSHLVIINSEEEAAILTKMLTRFPNIGNTNWAWIGMRESETVNNQYFTIFGKSLNDTGFTRWAPSEPNNPSTGDYMLMNRASGGLADVPVSLGWKNVMFVCEQELW